MQVVIVSSHACSANCRVACGRLNTHWADPLPRSVFGFVWVTFVSRPGQLDRSVYHRCRVTAMYVIAGARWSGRSPMPTRRTRPRPRRSPRARTVAGRFAMTRRIRTCALNFSSNRRMRPRVLRVYVRQRERAGRYGDRVRRLRHARAALRGRTAAHRARDRPPAAGRCRTAVTRRLRGGHAVVTRRLFGGRMAIVHPPQARLRTVAVFTFHTSGDRPHPQNTCGDRPHPKGKPGARVRNA